MKNIVLASQLIVLLSYSSCIEKKNYSAELCEELSMKFFRGLPKPSKEFKDNCGKYKLNYTQEKCKKALQDLMLGTNQVALEKKHGSKIMGCFNKGDLERFLKN